MGDEDEVFDAEAYVGKLSQEQLWSPSFDTIEQRLPGLGEEEIMKVVMAVWVEDSNSTLRVVHAESGRRFS